MLRQQWKYANFAPADRFLDDRLLCDGRRRRAENVSSLMHPLYVCVEANALKLVSVPDVAYDPQQTDSGIDSILRHRCQFQSTSFPRFLLLNSDYQPLCQTQTCKLLFAQ